MDHWERWHVALGLDIFFFQRIIKPSYNISITFWSVDLNTFSASHTSSLFASKNIITNHLHTLLASNKYHQAHFSQSSSKIEHKAPCNWNTKSPSIIFNHHITKTTHNDSETQQQQHLTTETELHALSTTEASLRSSTSNHHRARAKYDRGCEIIFVSFCFHLNCLRDESKRSGKKLSFSFFKRRAINWEERLKVDLKFLCFHFEVTT